MLTSLHYLLRDIDAAGVTIERADRDGDRSTSAANLKDLIDDERPEQLVHATPTTNPAP